MIVVCRSWANYLFGLAVLGLPSPDVLSNNVLTIEARPIWYPLYFGFLAIYNAEYFIKNYSSS